MSDKIKAQKRYFTRKHYIALQDIIRAHTLAAPIESQGFTIALVREMCMMFLAEYPEFDEDKFLRLCGLID